MKFLIVVAVFFAAANATTPCEMCENVLTPILNKATPADREKVVDVLKSLCFGVQSCVDEVNKISGDITSATPESLCTLVKLCSSTEKREFFSICSLCESGITKIQSQLSNETAAEIKEKLEMICFGNQACIAKVDSVVDEISTASPEEICTELHLCSSTHLFTYTSGRFCQMCEKVAEKFLSKINNQTIAELEKYLDAACRGNAQCLDAVQKLVSELSELTPESACQAVHLCGSSAADIRAVNKCEACKQKLNNVFSDDNLDKVHASLRKLCHGVTACLNEVTNVMTGLKADRPGSVQMACKVALQC